MAQKDSILNADSQIDDGRNINRLQLGVLFVVGIPLFFTVLNASAVTVLLPEMGRDLAIGTASLGWLMTGYLLVYGVAIPFYGRIADLYGARRLFLFGLTVFAIGSILSAIAPNYPLLLGARLIQAVGGAAIPGLGMAIASRAFPQEKRGIVLGLISATIGVGAAVGPLLGGVMSDAFGWRSVFVITALAGLTIPFGLKILSRDEERSDEPLDVLGGVLLALLVGGPLFAVSEGARSGWSSWQVLLSVFVSIAALIALSVRQRTAQFPFIPRELVQNRRYVLLVSMPFIAMASNVAALVGLPLLLTSVHDLTVAQVGFVLLPGAIMTVALGVIAGRLVDLIGARIPVRIGVVMMLVAMLGLSLYAGSEVWVISLFMAILGGGFALVNTPLAVVVSLVVRTQVLAMALSINTMLLFTGGGFGVALMTTIIVTRGGDSVSALNPLHSGQGAAFSDAFLVLAIPLILTMVLSLAIPRKVREPVQPEPQATRNWVPTCSIPWAPESEEDLAVAASPARET
ncbi:MAG: MFS transporter [Chloroflexi bacterium]|nr:MFS transporter [Chloroflexota bacterium]